MNNKIDNKAVGENQNVVLCLPFHQCSLSIEHNPNKEDYQTVAKWLAQDFNETYTWRDDDSRNRAVAENELWILQWYPKTPIGFYAVAAPTLQELITFAMEFDAEIND